MTTWIKPKPESQRFIVWLSETGWWCSWNSGVNFKTVIKSARLGMKVMIVLWELWSGLAVLAIWLMLQWRPWTLSSSVFLEFKARYSVSNTSIWEMVVDNWCFQGKPREQGNPELRKKTGLYWNHNLNASQDYSLFD